MPLNNPPGRETRLDELLAAIEAGVWSCDLPFDRLNWDPIVKQHFGLAPDAEVTIDTFYDRMHPEDRERVRNAIDASIANHTAYNVEFRTVSPSGQVRRIRAAGRAFYDPSGKPVRFDGVTIEQKHADDIQRQNNEEQFRTLADSMPQLAWMADPTGYIFWYNHRWYEYTGTSPEQSEGWNWQSVHDPDVLPNVLERWRHSIATGQPFDMVFPLRGRDGVFRPFLTRVMPVRDPQGRIVRWFGTNTDISEQRASENKLRSSQERLRAALEASSTGTFQWNILTNALDWDENLDRLFGLPPGHTVRSLENFIERVHPEDRAAVVEGCTRAAREGADF